MKPMWIMLTGAAGVGKSSLALVLKRRLDPDGRDRVCVIGFADALKDHVREMINSKQSVMGLRDMVPDHRGDGMTVEWRNRMRPLWQWFGTEWVRAEDPDHWVAMVEDRVLQYMEEGMPIIITDCRFDNERDWGVDNDFLVVRVIGPDRRMAQGGAPVPQHASEGEVVGEITVRNDGDGGLSDLDAIADTIIAYAERRK